MLKQTISVALFALALAGSAESAILGNGPPNQSGGSDLNAYLEADKFVLANFSLITQIQFWTLQGGAADYAGSTFWGIYTDSTGSPGTAINSGTPVLVGTTTGNTTFGLTEYTYKIPVNVALGAGTYWLVLHNGPINAQPATDFYWAWSADTGNSKNLDLSIAPQWIPNSSALAFELTTVPEPGSLSLMGTGLLAAWLVRKNRKGSN